MVVDSIELIEWSINSGTILTRFDILLLYYPSVYDFYWFTSRLLLKLESESHSSLSNLDYLLVPFKSLKQTLETTAT